VICAQVFLGLGRFRLLWDTVLFVPSKCFALGTGWVDYAASFVWMEACCYALRCRYF